MEAGSVSLVVALGAGVLSFFAPCLMTLLPVFITYINRPLRDSTVEPGRGTVFLRTCLFVLGFSTFFVLLGFSAGFIGSLFEQYRSIFERISGVIIILMGFYVLGALKKPGFLCQSHSREKLPKITEGSAYILGLAFAIGHSPHVGPVLGAILVHAAGLGDLVSSVMLLGAYSLGMALPFLAVSLFFREILALTGKPGIWRKYVPLASGILLVVFGILIFFDMLHFIH